ncbi:DUF6207 family protein [Streptomyces sp. NPDC093261]|uniref:DUF6207 family protein n=1 Tax=Streptomyces sp. NPDC093261 TaxID=3366037 RepID=UPI00380E04FC
MDPIREAHLSEPGLLVIDVAGFDDDTVFERGPRLDRGRHGGRPSRGRPGDPPPTPMIKRRFNDSLTSAVSPPDRRRPPPPGKRRSYSRPSDSAGSWSPYRNLTCASTRATTSRSHCSRARRSRSDRGTCWGGLKMNLSFCSSKQSR